MSDSENHQYPACPIGVPDWQYRCRACSHEFRMPVPSGPTEEKSRTCPACGSPDIERINTYESQACPPGG